MEVWLPRVRLDVKRPRPGFDVLWVAPLYRPGVRWRETRDWAGVVRPVRSFRVLGAGTGARAGARVVALLIS